MSDVFRYSTDTDISVSATLQISADTDISVISGLPDIWQIQIQILSVSVVCPVVRQRHWSGVEDMAAAVRAAQPRGVAADGAGEGARLELPPHTAALPLVHCLV